VRSGGRREIVLEGTRTGEAACGKIRSDEYQRGAKPAVTSRDATLSAPAAVASAEALAPAPSKEGQATLSNSRGRTLLAGFTAAHFSHHVSTGLLNPLLPLIRDGFSLSYAQSGFLVSAFSLSLGLSNAPIGVLADRIGPRPVIVAGLVLTGLVSVALGLAGAYWQLLVLFVMMGLIAGSYHAPAAALLARAFPARVRGAAMGLHITGGHLSFFATPLVAAILVSSTGTWRAPYMWFAFAPIALGAIVWLLAPRSHEPPSRGSDRLAVFREIWTMARLVGPLICTSIVFHMVYAALIAFMTLYLVDARGLAPPVAAALFGVPYLVGVFGSPLGGFLSDRLGRRAVILIGTVGLGPAFLAVTLVPNELLVLPLGAVGLVAAMRQTVTEVLVTDSAPANRRATMLGGYYMLSQELGGLAAPVLGLLAGTLGIATAFGSVTATLAALSGLVLLIQRRL
jgi:MFS family permease